MSVQNVEQFIDKIGHDEKLLAELKALGNPYSKHDRYSYAENILAPFAEKMGVPFFLEDWLEWREDMLQGILDEVERRRH